MKAMRTSKTVLHLLITALLVVPAVCCGSALETVSQAQPAEDPGDCPGHAPRDEAVPLQEGCAGCALSAATVHSAQASADEDGGSPHPDVFAGGPRAAPLSTVSEVATALAPRPYRKWHPPDTPVTLFDRLLLPS